MAVKSPTRSPQTPASATSRPLTPSSFPTTTSSPSNLKIESLIDSLLHHIESNTRRLALEAAYDPSIPFHPGCKDCVRDYVRHVRGAQPLKVAVEAAREGEKAKVEWEKKEKTVLREMRGAREEEVGKWEERWRRERGERGMGGGDRREETSKKGEGQKKGKDEAIKKSQSQGHSQADSSPASLAKAAKAMWGGRLARQGGEDVATPASTIAATQGAQLDPRVGASFGQDLSCSNIDTHGQDSRHDIEQAQQAFHDLDLDQQLALLLNAGQDS